MNIRSLNSDEEASIRKQIEAAQAFVDRFSPAPEGELLSLSRLDAALAAWLMAAEAQAAEIEVTVEAVAAAFGQLLVQHHQMSWVMVQSDDRSELAVLAFPGQGDVLVFPESILRNQLKLREPGYMERSYRQIARHVASLRKAR